MNSDHATAPMLPFPDADLPERIGPPTLLDAEQQQAADELIRGPRGGVYGPFRPLLHSPSLLRAVAKLGETLRYQGALDPAVREWTICVVAREVSNVFEWEMHAPLAIKAGVPATAVAALGAGDPMPDVLRSDLKLAHRVATEILMRHRLDETTHASAAAQWGDAALVELITLTGYFAMVSWLMNVARTPATTT